MDLNLSHKVYIVTGGSKGIGEGISRAIAAEGGIVVIATRSEGAVRRQNSSYSSSRQSPRLGIIWAWRS